MDISYTGLEAYVAVTRDISSTIFGWLLVKMADVCSLALLKFDCFPCSAIKAICISKTNFIKICQVVFVFPSCHLGSWILNIMKFYSLTMFRGRRQGKNNWMLCQTLSKLVSPLCRYHNLLIFKDGSGRHLVWQKRPSR